MYKHIYSRLDTFSHGTNLISSCIPYLILFLALFTLRLDSTLLAVARLNSVVRYGRSSGEARKTLCFTLYDSSKQAREERNAHSFTWLVADERVRNPPNK